MAGLESSPHMAETVVSEPTDLSDPRTSVCLASPVQLLSFVAAMVQHVGGYFSQDRLTASPLVL